MTPTPAPTPASSPVPTPAPTPAASAESSADAYAAPSAAALNEAGLPPMAPTGVGARTARSEPPARRRTDREVRLPLAVRKELLITRAALERYDCAQSLADVRASVRNIGRIGAWLPRMARPQSMWKLLGMAKDYPVMSSALSLALPLMRRVPVLRWGWKLSKLGAVAGAGYWAWRTWQQARAQTPEGNVPAAGTARDAAGARADTGFHDPLVR
ncbi:DUF3318 domain-containing protein [Cupriavidus gilardii]|uniref:DUF3318 domain-containing protein n=1 Tax=Cupriavidus gilardii TaxID=82541 RepID=UPI0009ED6D0B|nr:DUF3318 domain-containing protein [Cupriavidus gilardii]